MKLKLTAYLHSDKDSNRMALEEAAQEAGITASEEALYEFAYALLEVRFDLEVDTETGEYVVLNVGEE